MKAEAEENDKAHGVGRFEHVDGDVGRPNEGAIACLELACARGTVPGSCVTHVFKGKCHVMDPKQVSNRF